MGDRTLVRKGPVLALFSGLVLALSIVDSSPRVGAQDPPKPPAEAKDKKAEASRNPKDQAEKPSDAKGSEDAKPESKSKAEPKAATTPAKKAAAGDPSRNVPLDQRPYKIRAWLAVDPGTRLDSKGRDSLIASWRTLIARFVGPAWELEIAESLGPLVYGDLDTLDPKLIPPMASGFDKAWMIQISPAESGFTLAGREFDMETTRLGHVYRRWARYPLDVSRELFKLSFDVFAPSAEVGEQTGGGVMVTIQAGSLTPADPSGAMANVGSVFRPMRIWLTPDGKKVFKIDDIQHTYLRVESLNGAFAKCAISSGLRNPLTKMSGRKLRMHAVGVKPAANPSKFRFVYQPVKNPNAVVAPDLEPAAGFVLWAKTIPDGSFREVGTTDREGRVVMPTGFASGLVLLRLIAGGVEPLREFPTMPGEMVEERTVKILPLFQAVALETAVNSLKDEVVDQIGARARLEARMEARWNQKQYDQIPPILEEYRKLPKKDLYKERLAKMKQEAEKEQARLFAEKKPAKILTSAAQAQIRDTDSLIERYLTDEYADQLVMGLKAVKEGKAVEIDRGRPAKTGQGPRKSDGEAKPADGQPAVAESKNAAP